MSQIEVNVDDLEQAAKLLKSALDDFTPCYKEFVGSAMDGLESYSSDYLKEFEKLLRCFKDDRMKKTMDSVSTYCEELNNIYNIWNDTDEYLAMRIREGERA